MKTLYTLVAISLTCSITFAQNLTHGDIGYTIGESYTIYSNNQYLDPGSSGNGVTWDMSSITSGLETYVNVVENTSGNYPNANVLLQMSTGPEYFYNITNSAMDLVAYELSFTSIEYSNTARHLAFPVTSSLNQTDQYQAVADFSPDVYNRTGSVQIEYSGYGTLITPVGTYTNVVRVKTTESFTDVNAGGTYNTSIVAYDWYKAGIHREIAHYSTTVSNSGNYPSAYYTDETSGLDESSVATSIWPNPTQDFLNYTSVATVKSIQVINVQGHTISSTEVNASEGKLELTDLPSGLYFARFELENGGYSLEQFSKK